MPHKILIVDDDTALCYLLERALHEGGFETQTVHTGEDGLAAYRQAAPDLILLDVAMPGMSGFEVAAALRDLERDGRPHTPIVIMTAHAKSFQVSVDLQTGIDSFLTKPIPPEMVVVTVQNVLEGRR